MSMETPAYRPWDSTSQNCNGGPAKPQTLPPITSFMQPTPSTAPSDNRQCESAASTVPRDSGAWSMPQSTRKLFLHPDTPGRLYESAFCGYATDGPAGSSAYSASTMSYLNSSQPSPNGLSNPDRAPFTPDTSIAPSSSTGQPSPAASSSHANTTLPSINSNFEPNGQKGNGDHHESSHSSLDLRVNQGLDRLALNTQSPYASANASQTSLVSGLKRERGIKTNGHASCLSSASASSPLSSRTAEPRPGFNVRRTAPIIAENPRSDIYNAERPTAGQAYAFPDPDLPSRPEGRAPSAYSERDSLVESLTGSVYTTDSRLPPGQQGTASLR